MRYPCNYIATYVCLVRVVVKITKLTGAFMPFKNFRTLSVALAAGAFLFAAPSSNAQDTAKPQTQTQQQTQQVDFTDEQLNAYSQSAMKVSKIHAEMAPQIQAAESKEQKKQIFGTMQQQMIEAVKNTEGISVSEYNMISQAARQDEKLAGQISSKIKSMQN